MQDIFNGAAISVFLIIDMRVSVKELGASAVINGFSHGLLRDIRTGLDRIVKLNYAVTVSVLNRKDHAVALKAHHLAGFKINDHSQSLADEIFRLIVFCNTGEDLPLTESVIDLELQELVRLFDLLA